MKKQNILFLAFVGLFSFFIPHSVFANDLYQINLIVFKYKTFERLHVENWKNKVIKANLSHTIELSAEDGSLTYSMLSDSKRGLNKEASRLTRNVKDPILLAHLSWIQPITTPKTAQWVHISGGNVFNQNSFELDGKIKISRERFFNIDTKLYLFMPQSITKQPNTFTLIEKRRTKLHTLNYLDHPLFGALVQIEPVEEEDYEAHLPLSRKPV